PAGSTRWPAPIRSTDWPPAWPARWPGPSSRAIRPGCDCAPVTPAAACTWTGPGPTASGTAANCATTGWPPGPPAAAAPERRLSPTQYSPDSVLSLSRCSVVLHGGTGVEVGPEHAPGPGRVTHQRDQHPAGHGR